MDIKLQAVDPARSDDGYERSVEAEHGARAAIEGGAVGCPRPAEGTHVPSRARDDMTDSAFDADELSYLHASDRRLARVATADRDGHPQVTPVGMWRHNLETDTIDITGRRFATTKKFRNVAENPWAAVVIDDIASTDPWRPRAVLVQGAATAIGEPDRPEEGMIRITPDSVISWGLDPRPHAG